MLVLHGFNDPTVKVEKLKSWDQEFQGVDWKAELYGHTLHAFMNPAVEDPNAGLKYHLGPAKQGLELNRNFLKAVFS